jgi:hypothetical protein
MCTIFFSDRVLVANTSSILVVFDWRRRATVEYIIAVVYESIMYSKGTVWAPIENIVGSWFLPVAQATAPTPVVVKVLFTSFFYLI